jgi:hypothetical protein
LPRWKERIEQRLAALEQAQQPGGQMHDTAATIGNTVSADNSMSTRHHIPGTSNRPRSETVPPDETSDATLNFASNLGIFPAASIGPGIPGNIALPSSDIISRGIITSAVAEQYLNYFLEHLNRYLHGILSERLTLSDLRARSSILTTAVFTVASFCSASDSYQSCYDAFIGQVSYMLFATRNSYDDVRALCIAALWLDEIGPTLSGLGKTDVPVLHSGRADNTTSGADWLTTRPA